MATTTPASTASAGPSSGHDVGRRRGGRWARRGTRPGQQLGHQRGHRERRPSRRLSSASHGVMGSRRRRARAKASTVATSAGRSSVPASRASDPAGHHLAHGRHVGVGAVLRAAALVQRGERAQRRPAEGAQAIRVHRRDRAAALGRELAAAGDPHRVVAAARASRPGRRSRSGRPGARAGRTAPLDPGGPRPISARSESATVRWSPMPARVGCRSTTPTNSGRARVGEPRPETTITASTSSGAAEVVRQLRGAHLAQRRAVDRGQHERLARRAPLEHARQLEQRRGVGGAAGGVRTPAASAAATTTTCRRDRPARRPTTFTRSLAVVGEAVALHGEAAGRERACHRVRRWPGRPAVPGRRSGLACAMSAAVPRPAGRRRARRPPAPAAAGGADALEREHRQHDRQRGQARTPPCRCAARSRRPVHHRRNLQSRQVRQGMAAAPRILLVDDEQSVQKLLAYPLRKEGYEVVSALDGQRGARPAARGQLRPRGARPDAAEGRRVRGVPPDPRRAAPCRSSCSPRRPRRSTRCSGLELGADDYITKPFSVREFRSRVKAVLRRAALPRSERPGEEPLEDGELRIDFEKRQVDAARRAGPAHLRGVRDPGRARAPPGRVYSRTVLLERVWGDSSYRDPRTVDVHIRHLREKLETDPSDPGADPHGARRGLPLPGR